MKNWKKYAFASASVVALAAGLAACGNLTGNNKKAADSASGDKPVLKCTKSVTNQITWMNC